MRNGLLVVLVGCWLGLGCATQTSETPGGPGQGGTGGSEPLDCSARFVEQLADGSCAPVEVVGTMEEEVSFERDGLTLHGVLSVPVTAGSYRAPAAVLVHGSGPNDRDEHLAGSLGVPFPMEVATFASLADQLSRSGMVVLRYDKRTCFAENNPHCAGSYNDYPGGLAAIAAITPTDFAEDARAAIRWVAGRSEVRANDVVVMGHSQGGSFVPRLLAEESVLSAGVGLASPSLSFVDSLAGQLEVFANYLEEQDAVAFASDISSLRAEAADYRQVIPQIEAGTYPQSTFLGTPLVFWRDSIAWHAAHQADFEANDKPHFVLSGDADFNVWPEHLSQYEAWAESSNKTHVTSWLAPHVTHALVPIVAGTPPLTHAIDANVSAEISARIHEWLAALP